MGWLLDKRLLRAASRGDIPSIRHAVASGARLAATSVQGLTALMLAANRGHSESLEALVELGADVNHSSTVSYPDQWTGFTALMAAACDSTGRVEPVKTLIELGANAAAEDNLGRKAFDYATLSGYTEIEDFLANLPT